MFETLSRKFHPQKVVCRLSAFTSIFRYQDIKGNWTPPSAQEIWWIFKPFLHSHILSFKSVLREHKIFVQRVLVDAIISRGIFPTFNVQVTTSVKTGAQWFFYIILYLE